MTGSNFQIILTLLQLDGAHACIRGAYVIMEHGYVKVCYKTSEKGIWIYHYRDPEYFIDEWNSLSNNELREICREFDANISLMLTNMQIKEQLSLAVQRVSRQDYR